MINEKYDVLLREHYTDELYEFLLNDYINLFVEISDEKISCFENKDTEKLFTWLFWKAFKYSNNFINEILRLKELVSNIGLDDKEENMLCEMEQLYYDIKEKSVEKDEVKVVDFLKFLARNDECELAIEIIKNTYYYPLFVKKLKEKKVKFDEICSFSELLKIMKKYYREYEDILLNIDGIYPYEEITPREKLDDLLELTNFFDD